jgi:hypothetical protein
LCSIGSSKATTYPVVGSFDECALYLAELTNAQIASIVSRCSFCWN